jgi:WD40 repeat protein
VVSVSFSPDGSQVLTASADHTARLWDAATGSVLIPPLRHNDSVRVASFSADGRSIVTGSHDNTARVWDLTPSDSLFSDSSPWEDQLLWSQLVSSRRIDETGAITTLGAAEFQAAWGKVQTLRGGKH